MSKAVVDGVGLYITRGGRVAFMQSAQPQMETGEANFHGHIVTTSKNAVINRNLVWLECGTCVTSEDKEDQIIGKV